jgi:hypothetical protein
MAEQLESWWPTDGEHAVRLFLLQCAGVPAEVADMMQGSPDWEPLEALAHTLSYDVALHGPGRSTSCTTPRCSSRCSPGSWPGDVGAVPLKG